ncbi:13294_t:CDS:1, partial [Racocetra persica]
LKARIEAYEKLLNDIKTADDFIELQELNNRINTFDYTNFPADKNENILETAYNQRQTELQKQAIQEKIESITNDIEQS